MSELLLQIIEDPSSEGQPGWQARGLCAQTDPEAFFVEKGGSTRDAKKVCRSCEVRVECLDYAVRTDQRFGVWGGLSERERRLLKPAKERTAKGAGGVALQAENTTAGNGDTDT